MVTIKFKKLSEHATMPTKAHRDDAGYDLYACLNEDMIFIPPHQTIKIPTDIAMQIPEGYFGAIYARSGLASKNGLRPCQGTSVIDCGYIGNIYIPLHNDTNVDQVVHNGERIAQMIVQSYLQFDFEEVEELDETDRGDGGFGSSGMK